MGTSVHFSPFTKHGLALFFGVFSKYESDEGKIYLWDLETVSLIHTMYIWDETLRSAEFSPDGRYIISAGSRLNTITVWDVLTGKILAQSKHGGSFVYDINFSSDGTQFITLDNGGLSQMWDFSAFAPSGVDDYSLYR